MPLRYSLSAASGEFRDLGFRSRWVRKIERVQNQFPKLGAWARAMWLGRRDHLESDFREAMVSLGQGHVLAISGQHVWLLMAALSVLLSLVARLFWRWPAKAQAVLSSRLVWMMAVVCFLIYLTAGVASVYRVLVLYLMTQVVAPWLGFVPRLRSFLVGVGVLLLIGPVGWENRGFWLSVAATILLITWASQPEVGKKWVLFWIPYWLMPLTASWFGQVPLLAGPVSLVTAPIWAFWVLIGFLTPWMPDIFLGWGEALWTQWVRFTVGLAEFTEVTVWQSPPLALWEVGVAVALVGYVERWMRRIRVALGPEIEAGYDAPSIDFSRV